MLLNKERKKWVRKAVSASWRKENQGIVRAVFFIVPPKPPPASSSAPSPPSHQSLPRSCNLFYFLMNRKGKKQENSLCFGIFLFCFFIDCTFSSLRSLIVFDFIGAVFFDFSFSICASLLLFSFLYLPFLAVSRYLCCVVIVCQS